MFIGSGMSVAIAFIPASLWQPAISAVNDKSRNKCLFIALSSFLNDLLTYQKVVSK